MKTDDFDFELPENLIAQTPAEPRDSSRLLVYDRKADTVYHKTFRDIKQFLKKGDLLVRNNTKVLPARMFAYTVNGGKVEVLLLKRFNLNEWEVLVKPGKKALIVDDFMKGGGTLRGMLELMREFQVEVVGSCVLITAASEKAEKYNVKSLLTIERIDEANDCAVVAPSGQF